VEAKYRDDTVVFVYQIYDDLIIKGITHSGELIEFYSGHDIEVGEFLIVCDEGGYWTEYKTRATLADFIAGKPAWED
jgi:hypothetical protein